MLPKNPSNPIVRVFQSKPKIADFTFTLLVGDLKLVYLFLSLSVAFQCDGGCRCVGVVPRYSWHGGSTGGTRRCLLMAIFYADDAFIAGQDCDQLQVTIDKLVALF